MHFGAESFFRMGDTHMEVRHLEKDDSTGTSRSDLHNCAKTAVSRQFKTTKSSMDEKNVMNMSLMMEFRNSRRFSFRMFSRHAKLERKSPIQTNDSQF